MVRFAKIFTLMLIAVTAAYLLFVSPNSAPPQGEVAIGGDFTLTDSDGKTVTNESLKGASRLVYFGFTYCPEICPTALLTMGKAAELLGSQAPKLVFISVDPERDTVAQLHDYAQNFPGVTFLTGAMENVKEAAKAYRVYYSKNTPTDNDYMIDHSSYLYLMDAQGKYLAHFPHTIAPKKLADGIRAALQP